MSPRPSNIQVGKERAVKTQPKKRHGKPSDSELKTKQNPQINAIKAESNYNASKGEGSRGEGLVTVFIFFIRSGIIIKGRTQ